MDGERSTIQASQAETGPRVELAVLEKLVRFGCLTPSSYSHLPTDNTHCFSPVYVRIHRDCVLSAPWFVESKATYSQT